MEQTTADTRRSPKRVQKTPARKIAAVVLVILLLAYGAVCLAATKTAAFFPRTRICGVDVGGLSPEAAAQTLGQQLADGSCAIYLDSDPQTPAATLRYADLGMGAQSYSAAALEQVYADQHDHALPALGLVYLKALLSARDYQVEPEWSTSVWDSALSTLSQQLSAAPQDTSFRLEGDTLRVTMARDGRSVGKEQLETGITAALSPEKESPVTVVAETVPAQTLSAQELYDAVSTEMKNASYDPATGSIVPEQAGATFDVEQAAGLLDAAQPGEEVSIPATVQQPAVTAEKLKAVLFKDVLGSCTTHVGGSSARISNVKLASAAVNGTVLNSGDIFSYNGTVGQRTTARGYQPAPAYVKGETVDEVGGGVCQPSSTLYLACLLSNLEITERYAHRYVPSYVPKGMDATVSWGGPDYKFRNNTDYPIKITATYSKGYLTMKIYGTKTDDLTVKMTNEVLSTTNWETVYEDDASAAAGSEQVKVTPYTGYKVRTFRNLYSGDGKLISSTLEATSDYKVRNKVIVRGPALPASGGTETPGSGTETPLPGTDPTPDPGTGGESGSGSHSGEPEPTPDPAPATPEPGGEAPEADAQA